MELGSFSVSLSVKDIAASQDFYSKLGFEPTLATTEPGVPQTRAPIAIPELPHKFRELFSEARRLDKPLVFDFTAPG